MTRSRFIGQLLGMILSVPVLSKAFKPKVWRIKLTPSSEEIRFMEELEYWIEAGIPVLTTRQRR
jgi:hypothetical protein